MTGWQTKLGSACMVNDEMGQSIVHTIAAEETRKIGLMRNVVFIEYVRTYRLSQESVRVRRVDAIVQPGGCEQDCCQLLQNILSI